MSDKQSVCTYIQYRQAHTHSQKEVKLPRKQKNKNKLITFQTMYVYAQMHSKTTNIRGLKLQTLRVQTRGRE